MLLNTSYFECILFYTYIRKHSPNLISYTIPFFLSISSSSAWSSASISAPREGLFPCFKAGSRGSFVTSLLFLCSSICWALNRRSKNNQKKLSKFLSEYKSTENKWKERTRKGRNRKDQNLTCSAAAKLFAMERSSLESRIAWEFGSPDSKRGGCWFIASFSMRVYFLEDIFVIRVWAT